MLLQKNRFTLITMMPFFVKRFTLLLLILSPLFIHAQTVDDFTDGDLTANPAWQGDVGNFKVNAAFQLQLMASEAGNSSLYLPVGFTDSTVWELYFHLDFDPSSSNRLKIYLQSNTTNLSAGNGFFLEAGEDGTSDALKFYRQDAGNAKFLAASTPGSVAVAPEVRLKITRKNGITWTIAADFNGGTNFSPLFEVTDANYNSDANGFFGLHCSYTATRKDKFYFDEISVPSPVPDFLPPVLVSAKAISAGEIDVIFDEPLDEISATEPSNFSISNGVGEPAAAFLDANDKMLIHLSLATPLVNLTNYTLTTSNISDLSNNISPSQMTGFSYLELEAASEYDILINEIMADPTPSVTLPQVEFIELFNRSNKVIDLAGFTFSSGGTPQVFPSFHILPGSFVLVCDDTRKDSLAAYGDVISLPNFPALTNDADELTLKDTGGKIIHYVNYNVSWYKDVQKAQGGWTLELVNPGSPCESESNWRASASLKGGTPGKPNAVLSAVPDETGPKLVRAFSSPDSPDEIRLYFNERLDKNKAENISGYQITPNIGIYSATLLYPSADAVLLELVTPLQKSVIYQVTALDTLADCIGNRLLDSETSSIALPELANPQDLIVNEILFNPETGGYDFIEIYNRSNKIFNLSDLVIGNIQEDIDTVLVKVVNDRLIFPGEYIVLTEKPADILSRYLVKNENALLLNGLPTFNDNEGNVTVFRNDTTGVIIIDAFDYNEKMHYPLLEDVAGVSLERIDPNRPAQDRFNWHSAAEVASFATPTYKNSQFIEYQQVAADFFQIPEPTFSPDGDGYNDFMAIFYKTDNPGYTSTVKVFDAEGRPVKTLTNNELLSTEGFLRWDGDTDEDIKAKTGIYIIWIQLFNPDGNGEEYKYAVVLANKL